MEPQGSPGETRFVAVGEGILTAQAASTFAVLAGGKTGFLGYERQS
jgi:hypothetical protein